jgi:predicted nucleotidyltransferase
MNTRTSHISQLIKRNISEIDPLAQIILFGSRARGDERTDSDWDLLILTDYPVSLNKEREFRNHLYDLELETGEPFSLFAYSKVDWETKQKITPFYQSVTKEGICL